MAIEDLIYTRLSGHGGLAALVGTRIYPVTLPQGVALPAVSYRRVSAQRPSAMGTDTGLVRARFQFDAWAQDSTGSAGFDAMRAVAEQLRSALQRWRDPAGPPVVQDTFFENETDLYEDAVEIHHGALDFEIIYQE